MIDVLGLGGYRTGEWGISLFPSTRTRQDIPLLEILSGVNMMQ